MHAPVVERHHEILRQQLHRLLAAARSEGLTVNIEDALAEATFAKNVMLQVHGTTPYLALFGRYPQILSDLETSGQSALTDSEGGLLNASRHAVRLRELAVETIIQAHAAERLKRAANSHSRPSGE
jgi:hypothetical protein